MKHVTKNTGFYCIILIFGFLLRIVSINQSLWLDEAIEWWAVKSFSLSQLLGGYMIGDFNPPAHHVLLWVWARLAGDSEFLLRLPSICFGIGTAWMTYLIARIVCVEKKEINFWPLQGGIPGVAFLFSAVSGLLVYYSQEARMYAMAAFFVSASVYAFLKYHQHPSRLRFTFYVLLFAIAMYTHYLVWFLLPFFALWGIQFLAPLLFLIPWIPTLLLQLSAGISSAGNPVWAQISRTSIQNIALVVVKFVTGRIPFPQTLFFQCVVIALVVAFWLLVFSGAILLWKKQKNNLDSRCIVIFWAFGPLVVGATIGIFIPIFSYFRFLFVLPAIIILSAQGCVRLRGLLEPVFAGLLITSLLYVSNIANHREDWKSAADIIHAQSSNAVVLLYPAVFPPFLYYDKGISTILDAENTTKNLAIQQIWFITYAQPIFDPENKTKAFLTQQEYRRVYEHHFRGVTVERWEK